MKKTPKRFLFVDGLRGVAAMMVVFYHFRENIIESVEAWFPSVLDALFARGNLGVDIFFVLSGFVIAHSVRAGRFTLAFLGRFALRRSIRLDPPLWVTIGLEVVLVHQGLKFFPGLGTLTPTAGEVISNLTYTQRFLGFRDVVPVFWSLTYEVQFYVVLVLACVLAAKTLHWKGLSVQKKDWVWSALSIPFLYSSLIYLGVLPLPLRGIFLDRWFQFYLGVGAWAALQKKISSTHLLSLAGTAAILATILGPGEYRVLSTLIASMTAVALFFAGRAGAMHSLLSGPVFQFLGKISYSLYLTHLSVGWRFISLWKQLLGPDLGPVSGSLAFAGGVLSSILAAWLFYLLLEAPSMRLARRVYMPTESVLRFPEKAMA